MNNNSPRTADGVVRGAYQYVDSDGIVQTVNYIADALGFRVGASNLPVHHVEGASLPETEQKVEEPVAAAYHHGMTPAVDYSYLPYATSYGYNVPYTQLVQSAPVVSPAPAPVAVQQVQPVVSSAPVAVQQVQPVVSSAPVAVQQVQVQPVPADLTNSQFHAQDDIGQYNYGYSSPTSTKQELKVLKIYLKMCFLKFSLSRLLMGLQEVPTATWMPMEFIKL